MSRSPFVLVFTPFLLFLMLPFRSLGGGTISPSDSAVRVTFLSLHGGFQVPLNDLRDRFGNNGMVGAAVGYKFKKRWMLQAQWSYLFGNAVKENNILQPISTSDGFIIDQNGEQAGVRFFERGMVFGGQATYLLPSNRFNPNTGWMIGLQGGWMQTKIRIEDVGNRSPQLAGDYIKGYDRLSGGPFAGLCFGFWFMGNNRVLNGYVLLEYQRGYTRSLRSFNYDTRVMDTRVRNDGLIGIRLGYVLPLYPRNASGYYTY